MGSINYGNQVISVGYKDPANAWVVNKRHLGTRARGIYKGGLLSKVSDVSVEISPLLCEIGDANHQVRVETSGIATVEVNSSTPVIVLRWAYIEETVNFMDILAVTEASVQENDIIVGKAIYIGLTLQGFSYVTRTVPLSMSTLLKVVPTSPVSMRLHVKGGRISFKKSYLVEEQDTSAFVAPTAKPRIDFIYVDKDGLIKVAKGAEADVPEPASMSGKVVLALVKLSPGMTDITEDDLVDVRSFLAGGSGGGGSAFDISQEGHGFLVGDILAVSETGLVYVKAIADTMANANRVVGVVSEVPDVDNYVLSTGGLIEGLSGLTPGNLYYLSNTQAGVMVNSEPENISRLVFVAVSEDSGFYLAGGGVKDNSVKIPSVKTVSFTYANLSEGVLDVVHNLDTLNVLVQVRNDSGERVEPFLDKVVDENTVKIGLPTMGEFTGTWKVIVLG